MKNSIIKIVCATLVAANGLSANAANVVSVIPQPQSVKMSPGNFMLLPATRITFDGGGAEAQLLAATMRKSTGYKLWAAPASTPPEKCEIRFQLRPDLLERLGPEGYQLSVQEYDVAISAPTTAGLFYGSQTLLQLLPPEIFSSKKVEGISWKAPCVEISDAPRFVWRGFMLDVSRHFFNKAEVEQVLDLMALYKLNTFHWHLVDDQGWRIEIKKYPRLTSVGAWRAGIGFGLNPQFSTAYDRRGRYGGFYTQRDIREIVAYAAARHITIVPEIEMPGHSSAALSAYPQFACPDAKISLPAKGGVFTGVYCAGNDATYAFLGDILAEVAQLFPGKYIHIGGDEVVKSNWMACARCQARIKNEGLKGEKELQASFTRRIEKIVNAQGKSLIGWSEIREGGLAPSAALMDWRGGGAESAASGHDVVMAPTKFCYFDYYQSTNKLAAEPKAIGNFLPLKKVYAFDPLPPKLAPEFRARILGGQANLWTEYVPNLRQVEYMMFPRLEALAEADWSPKEKRSWEDFKARVTRNENRLDALGVNYRSVFKPD
jgi:hexosaminidase